MLEYVGVVALVAAVVAALVGAGFAGTVTHRFDCAIRGALGDADDNCPKDKGDGQEPRAEGSSTSEPSGTSEPPKHDPGGPVKGPALGDAPKDIPILPFPSKVSIEGKAETPGRLPVKTSVTGTSVVERNDSTLSLTKGPNGGREIREQVKLGVTSELKVTTSADGELGRVGVTLKKSMGGKSTYDVYVTPKQADKMEEGKMQAPHPARPHTMPVGAKIVLGKEYFHGHGMDGSYRALRAESGVTKGHRASAGVVKVDKDHVKIMVGRSDYISNLFNIGLGTDNFNISLGASRKLGSGRARQMTLDISTKKGWAAYQHFLRTGHLPKWGPDVPYLSKVGRLETTTLSSQGGLEANAGPLHAEIPFGHTSKAKWVETHYADGSYDYTLSYRVDGITYLEKHRKNTQGKEVDSEYGILLHDAASSYLDLYQKSASKGGKEEVDAYLTFTEDQLRTMKKRTYRTVATRCREHEFRCPEGGPTTVAGVKRYVRKHPHRLGAVFGPSGRTTMLMEAAARAKDPAKILATAHRLSNGNPTLFLDIMTRFGIRTGDTLSGDKARKNRYRKYIPGDVTIRQRGG